MFETPDIPGVADVIAWFGYWPTFHDAEVVSILLDRTGESRIAIHAWEQTRELDSRGYPELAKNAIVTFCMEGFPLDQYGITSIRIEAFNHQNVLSSASVCKRVNGYELMLEGCFGVDGSIVSERLSVRLEPGIPPPIRPKIPAAQSLDRPA